MAIVIFDIEEDVAILSCLRIWEMGTLGYFFPKTFLRGDRSYPLALRQGRRFDFV